MSDIHAFADDLGPDLSTEVEAILAAPGELTANQAEALFTVLAPRFQDDSAEYGAHFDMAAEVSAQIKAVRAMRRSVMTDAGTVQPGVAARELKEVVSASNTLLQTLLKTHERLLNFDRQRALEAATVTAVETLPEENQQTFFKALEAELEAIQ